jgi:trans-2,3-dihydro-3-hydroxyanthranilate isomerase
MRKLRYHLVDVFTDRRFGGNPLAVFTNGRGVPDELMQAVAKELNLSETTFVLPPADPANDWRVRIFTPAREMPMAGHPTLGTSFILAREHLVEITGERTQIRLEEQVGVIPVTFQFEDDGRLLIWMQQPLPTFGPVVENRAGVAQMLALTADDLDDYPVQVVSCGVPFLYVPVKTLYAAQQMRLRTEVWEQLYPSWGVPEIFAFSRETVNPTSTVHSRMFAPEFGIVEDPATGAASGPLGCYLVKYGIVSGSPAQIISEQGLEIGRPSFIHIEISHEAGQISRVRCGGQSVYVGEGMIEV